MYSGNPNGNNPNMQYSNHSQNKPNPQMHQQPYNQGYPPAAAHPQQFPPQEMMATGPGPMNQYAAPIQAGHKQPVSLIQPPALNVEENINTNSQFLPQRGNPPQNDNSEFDINPQQEG